MKALVLVSALALLPGTAPPKETTDLIAYTAPAGWTKEVKPLTYVSWTTVNQQKKDFCRIAFFLSTASKGSAEKDFESEWQNLIVKEYTVTGKEPAGETRTENGWQIKAVTVPVTFSGTKATAMLTTMSGYGKAMSILAVTNSNDYLPDIRKFLDSVEPKTPAAAATPAVAAATPATSTNPDRVLATTNFDDGWTSTAQEDWAKAVKGTTTILIHYPNKTADAYNSVVLDGLKNAWNVLVAPRYSSMSAVAWRPVQSWEVIEFAEADAVEKATGKSVHVVLFKKNVSNGSGRYLEFITPDKAAFEKEFGPYHATTSGWEKMAAMANYNKFGISPAGLSGKWTSNFSGAIQYVNAYTGVDAGMDTHASNENFQFSPGGSYKWDLGVASGPVGAIKFQSVKSAGTFTVSGDWRVTLSDIEGKPRTYDAYFSHIKGLRVLWLDNRPFAKAD